MQGSNNPMEEWRPIVDYPEYEVSNAGNVRRNGRVLKPSSDSDGYLIVSPCKNNIQTTKKVHRLIAIAFIPNPNNKPQIDHINRIKTDNRVENLRWATYSENNINRPIRSEHRHIQLTKWRSYRVQIQRNSKYVFIKSYPTLAEAVAGRDAFLSGVENGLKNNREGIAIPQ